MMFSACGGPTPRGRSPEASHAGRSTGEVANRATAAARGDHEALASPPARLADRDQRDGAIEAEDQLMHVLRPQLQVRRARKAIGIRMRMPDPCGAQPATGPFAYLVGR